MSVTRYPFQMVGGVPVVRTPTEIDMTTAGKLRAILSDCLSRGHATVVVDMTGTQFCDCAGLRELALAHKRAVRDGGALRLVIPAGGVVMRVFTVTGLDRLIPRFAAMEQALAQVPAAPGRIPGPGPHSDPRPGAGDGTLPGLPGPPGRPHHRADYWTGRDIPQPDQREGGRNHSEQRTFPTPAVRKAVAMPAGGGTVRWVGPDAVVALPAEIDAANADKIGQELLRATSLGAAVVVIDMSATTFCDSAGVQAIIATYRHASANGTQLRLVGTTMLRVLTLVGADQLVPIYPTLEAALAATPPGQASTPDPGYEPSGTTISGDRQAQPPRTDD